MAEDPGLTVPEDAHGCLQEIRCSTGYVGPFPTCTIGSIMAAQVMHHLCRRFIGQGGLTG